MTYNITFISNTTSLAKIFTGLNTASGEWLLGLVLIGFFAVFYITFRQHDTKTVFLAGSFLTSILAGLFYAAGLVDVWVLGVCVALLVGSLIAKIWGD